MKNLTGAIRLSATDLSNHLGCAHLTAANLGETLGERQAPPFRAPDLVILQQRGLEHEETYIAHLTATVLGVVNLREAPDDAEAVRETQKAMRAGADVIIQGALEHEGWFGRPDVLRRVEAPSELGAWSYEPYDCKLARETRAATILQLSHYAALLTTAQGREPEHLYVVPPSDDLSPEVYRVLDFAANYRTVRSRLQDSVARRPITYPEPNDHCEVCRWWPECDRQWRRDDHLSLTAGISRFQRKQLIEWEMPTMTELSRLPVPLTRKPRHGAKAGYERIRDQARVQVAARQQKRPVHELLTAEPNRGLARLPEPSDADLFFDLESDPFVGKSGREYLFGFVLLGPGDLHQYECRWALNAAEEKTAFEWFVDFVMTRWRTFPSMHIYHYGHKEPSTLKALMGRYATREDAIDRMLRAELMVDLHSVTKQAVRAGIEQYSLKALEEFHGFKRRLSLDKAKSAMRQVEHQLELDRPGTVEPDVKDAVEAYNSDDCHSTRSLRDWLEQLRKEQIADGEVIGRPTMQDGDPSAALGERQERVAKLISDLTSDVSTDVEKRNEEQSARWLLANLLDWHRREEKVAVWEKYRLRDMSDEDLQDERAAIAGLQHRRTIPAPKQQRLPTDEYGFPPQETNLHPGDDLYHAESKIGTIDFIDPVRGVVGIKKTQKMLALHPSSVYSYEIFDSRVLADSLFGFGEWVREHGFMAPGPYESTCDLLLRRPPRTASGTGPLIAVGESVVQAAKRLGLVLENSVLAIQGPPGAGKTYTGAEMIVDLIRAGKRVGVAAGSHKVIRKLLDKVHEAAAKANLPRAICLHKVTKKAELDLPDWLAETTDNGEALRSLQTKAHDVVAGTPWLWSRDDLRGAVDVLFVDEAGQMSLANALAISPATKSLVLLGDPRQLDQPLRGSHPDGAEASALEHLLNGAKTIASNRGLFLDKTWRLHPDICRFTSEVFYENRLESRKGLQHQRIEGHPWLGETGLRFVPVEHEGNQNSSPEEVDYITELVEGLLGPDFFWVNDAEQRRPLRPEDILIVAPYNAQVAALSNRLPNVATGTVDKFQGQEAPVVIYSLTTSSPEDAPRGMEFLYSVNRLNVATSRARALAIVVASPKLLEPECRNPRQMQLANALCRYVEFAPSKQMALGTLS
jgi:uncharacterized protein